ncbi:MAG: diiron oxygenase [Mycolicibacterium fortuitum]|uniref:diiron oxygenase n=1 Tax=Mycolicibacterium fortuitum TaxID=1766 RepID=UPI001CDC3665|nr:diiron oxygenase [Mycolicibacterium fortuitum]UBV20608.1 diiron oxygenase [Mycolicibacterium fortuitum]
MTTSVRPGAGSSNAARRDVVSERLLKGSVRKSYAPVVDIDWQAPIDPDKFFLPPRVVSLYGTPLWDSMSREEQIELSRQELANTLSAGIWFENILNQALLRKMMHQDPTSTSTHYELTELGDETRHMVMFGKAIDKIGAKPVRPRLYQRMIINTLPFFFRGSVLWVAALVGEEIFDSLQRQMMDDPELQPMVQRLMRIHVTEEARHIQFARDGLRQRTPSMRWYTRAWVANLNGVGGYFFRYLFTNKVQYARVGLDARAARRIARASAHRREVQVSGFAPLAAFLEEVGLMGRIGRRMWRRSGFLPAKTPPLTAAASGSAASVETELTEEVFDGFAILDNGEGDRRVHVRLTGHLDPIDGKYHWRGTILDAPATVAAGPVRLTIGTRTVDARITERTSQGTHSIAGIGEPPFALESVDGPEVSAAG